MKILELHMRGFLSHEDTKIDFSDLNYVAISGENGAGKSSIRQAISWAIYGTTRVRANHDSVVNENSNEAVVELIGETEDGQTVKIIRTRGWNASGKVRVYDLKDGEWVAYGDHLNTTAQKRIQEIVGLDEDAYYSLSVIESSAGSRFVLADSTQRREILLGLIPELSDWPVMHEKAKAAAAHIETLMETTATKLERTHELIAEGEEKVTNLQVNLAEHQEDIPEEEDFDGLLEDISQKIGAASSAKREVLSRIQEEKSNLDLKLVQIDGEIDQLEALLKRDETSRSRRDKTVEKVDRLKAELKAAKRALSAVEDEDDYEGLLSELESNLEKINGRLSETQSEISLYASKLRETEEHAELMDEIDAETGVCYVCKSELSPEVHQQLIQETRESQSKYSDLLKKAKTSKRELSDKADEVSAEIRSVRQRQRRAEAALSEAENKVTSTKELLRREKDNLDDYEEDLLSDDQIKEYNQKITELDDQAQELQDAYNSKTLPKLQKELNKLEGDSRVDELTAERRAIQDRKEEFDGWKRREASLLTKIKEAKSSVKKLNLDAKEYRDSTAPLRKKLEDTQYLVKALSSKGVPSMLLDSILASIEDRQNAILASIPGSEWMKVEFAQTRDQKNGNKRDVLDILVHTESGQKRHIESFSSGERVKLTISNVFAMAQVFNERRPGTVDYLFLDEPLGVLDQKAVPAFIDVLRSVMNQNVVSSVYIVAHDQRVIDALPQSMIVTKVDNSSQVRIA